MVRRGRITCGALVAAIGLLAIGAGLTPAAAQTPADSTVQLQWTAPGDDGNSGRATTYEMRYRTVAISGTDTTGWWNLATPVTGLPSPGFGGASETVTVRHLDPSRTYWFVMRTADEVPNWSFFSNVVSKVPYRDQYPPAAINDLSISLALPNEPEPAGDGAETRR